MSESLLILLFVSLAGQASGTPPPASTKPRPDTDCSSQQTVVDVFGNEARPIRLRIRAIDHASYEVRVQWLNEQLLWLHVPRGRIVTLDAVLDVDTGRFVYERDAFYGTLSAPCTQSNR
jgi:hypothetical protein